MIASVICISSKARIETRNTGSPKMYAWRQMRRSAWLPVLLTALLNVIIFVGILWNVGGDLVVDSLVTC